MRFYNEQHPFYCGIDLHTKKMFLCIVNQQGKILLHRNMQACPEAFLKAIAPYRDGLVVGAECMFTWYWLADVCAKEHIPFVLGHALYMRAIHGGKAKNDKIDSEKIAGLLRGGQMPMAYVYPTQMRATRDLLRRRLHFVHHRSELLTHIQQTNRQYNLPEFEHAICRQRYLKDLARHFPDPDVRRSMEANIDLLDHYHRLITQLELYITRNAKIDDADTLYRLRSIPGVGKILSLTLMYEIHDINRFENVRRFVSYARLIKPRKESDGKRCAGGGAKIGNAHLKWAFSEAVCLLIRESKQAKTFVAKKEKKFGKGKAMGVLAHRIGRAVYYMLKRKEAFNMRIFFAN